MNDAMSPKNEIEQRILVCAERTDEYRRFHAVPALVSGLHTGGRRHLHQEFSALKQNPALAGGDA